MTFIRKLAAPLGALTVATLLFGAYVTSAHAQTPPYSAYGTGLSAGDTVEAFVGGTSCGSVTADASGNWLLQIGSDAPCGPQEGDAISFTLNGQATMASETYRAGGAPTDVAAGITLEASGEPAPGPAETGNAGLLAANSTGLAAMIALGAFALLAIGGARVATRKR